MKQQKLRNIDEISYYSKLYVNGLPLRSIPKRIRRATSRKYRQYRREMERTIRDLGALP
jgi:hypothetical protein